jgi:hypothetical protein
VQVGFGSGFKCNSAVWKATRNIHDTRHVAWLHMKNGNLEKAWQYVQVRRRRPPRSAALRSLLVCLVAERNRAPQSCTP